MFKDYVVVNSKTLEVLFETNDIQEAEAHADTNRGEEVVNGEYMIMNLEKTINNTKVEFGLRSVIQVMKELESVNASLQSDLIRSYADTLYQKITEHISEEELQCVEDEGIIPLESEPGNSSTKDILNDLSKEVEKDLKAVDHELDKFEGLGPADKLFEERDIIEGKLSVLADFARCAGISLDDN